MCQQRNIKIINHTDTIDPSKYLSESLFHRIVIAQLNLNSLRNKFESLSTVIKHYVD